MNEQGRSMVEMLGVLAIIGVLSVGAIAGYSKAMYKYKLNKQIQEYNYIYAQLKTLHDGFKNLPDSTGVIPYLINLGIISDSQDVFGNEFNVRYWSTFYILDIYLSSNKMTSADKVQNCRDLLSNLFIPLHQDLHHIYLQTGVGGSEEEPGITKHMYHGDKDCTGNKLCIRDMNLSQIEDFCNSCDDERTCRIMTRFI